jgi:hypothetical protein
MALINLKTNLKSLKYGNDRPGNGSSGQPYIQTDINRPGDNLIGHLDDGLVRGGALGAAKASLIDTLRISKFLVDFPKGPLFIAKQVGLQLSNPQIEHKTDLPTNKPTKGQGLFRNIGNFVSNTANKIENAVGPTRLYNLGINTLAQVPVTAFGQHIVRHGFLPVKDNDKLYFKVAQYNNNEANNNLVKLTSILGTTNDIKNYIGGPGSIYGLGSTIIRRRGDFIDINRDTTASDWAVSGSFNASKKHYYLRTNNTLGLSKKYFEGISSFDENGIKYGFIDPEYPEYGYFINRPSSYNQTTIKGNVVGSYTYDDLKQQIFGQQQLGFTALSSSFKIDINNPNPINYYNTLGLSKEYFNTFGKLIQETNIKSYSSPNTPSYINQTTITNNKVGSYTYDDLQKVIDKQQKEGFAKSSYLFKPDTNSSKNNLSEVRQIRYLGVSNQTTSSFSKFPTKNLDIKNPEETRDLSNILPSENDGKYNLGPKPIVNPLEYNYLGTGSNAISNYNENLKDEGIINASLNNNAVEKNNQVLKTYSNLYNQIQTQIKKTKRVNTYVVGDNSLISSSTLSSRTKTIIPFSIDNRVGISGAHKSDEINLTPLFDSKTIGSFEDKVLIGGKIKNIQDLVKFRIQAINTDGPEQRTTWMVFRAFLTDFSDNVTGDWSDVKYVGRGEKFFIYNGFTRNMSISFKVAALSREEMEPMYQKLNYLMSNLMPDYKNNFMRGPLIRMTVGNYIDGQPGILTSLSYKISNDTPWEISVNNDGLNNQELNLPHIVEVSLGFTPIGSQTRDKNLISEKASTTSHIAQNWNGGKSESEGEYIYPDINKVIKNGIQA